MSNYVKNRVGDLPRRRLSWRRATFLGFTVVFFTCLYLLGMDFNQLPDSADPLDAAKRFFSAAFHPAFADQNPSLPSSVDPFLSRLAKGIFTTLRYAFIAMSMAFPAGMIIGYLASSAHSPRPSNKKRSLSYQLLRTVSISLRILTRTAITFMRSIHELIWVLLFLAFLGDSPITACIALALPFTGTLAKVFSEIIDEQSSANSLHLRLAGGSSLQAFFTARLPEAFPDILSYTMYRLECSIRSSAVLGFIGIETIGLSLFQSYENSYYQEVWSALYLLVFTVMCFDILGSFVRKRLQLAPPSSGQAITSPLTVASLYKNRPTWRAPKFIWAALTIAVFLSWFGGEPLNQYHSHISRIERTKTFLTQLTPTPVRVSHQWQDAIPWAKDLWLQAGQDALIHTLLIATTALLLAALAGYTLVPWASRNIATSRPFDIHIGKATFIARLCWRACGFTLRFIFLLARSIPEYILAFLLIGILGAHAWPLIIALAIHNFGILGRLWGEVSENNATQAPAQIMLRGGSRLQSYLCCSIPAVMNRQLLFIFYRWETCVRESTILGMLSISSLGYYISLESSFLRYDRMLFFILLGTTVILISDILSVYLRSKLNK